MPVVWLHPAHLDAIRTAADAAYPHECCGLLLGTCNGDDRHVDQVVESANLSANPANSFEIDMRLRLSLQKQLRGTGREIVGHYHSHPDGPARPSERDREQAWEPDLVWLIVGVTADGHVDSAAHLYREGCNAFESIGIRLYGE